MEPAHASTTSQRPNWIPDFDEKETKWMYKPKPLLEIFERLKKAKMEETTTPINQLNFAIVHFLELEGNNWGYDDIRKAREKILDEVLSEKYDTIRDVRFAAWLQTILGPLFIRLSFLNQFVQHQVLVPEQIRQLPHNESRID